MRRYTGAESAHAYCLVGGTRRWRMSLDGVQQDHGRGMKKDNHNIGFFPSANAHANLGRMNQGARMGGYLNFGRGQAMGLQAMEQMHQNIISSGIGPSRSSSGLTTLFDMSSRNQPSLAAQKRIDADKASNILATFGLSSRDLDELSRYPADKLTPESLPDILLQLKRKRNNVGASLNYNRGDISPREDRSFRGSHSEWQEERRFRNNFEGRDPDADPVVNYDHGSSRELSFRYYDRKDYEPERLRGDDFRRDDTHLSDPMYKYDSDYGKMGPPSRGQERSLFERKRGSPSLSNINDYHGFLPRMFPHLCSLCDVNVHSVKEWNQHKHEPAHKRRCLLLLEIYPQWVPEDVPSARNNPARQSNLASDAASAILAAIRRLDALDPHGGNRQGQIQNKRNMAVGEPGQVLHMTELPKGKCKVKDILKLAQPFGSIAKYLLLNTKSEGFVQMATSGQAQAAVAYYSMNPAILYGKKVRVDISLKYKEIDLKQKQESGGRVALLQNLPPSGYSDADVVKMGTSFGKVLNYIVMRLRNQAFLEMESRKCMLEMVKYYKKKPLIFQGRKITVDASQKYRTLVLKKPSIKVQEVLKDQDKADRRRRHSRSPSKKKVLSKSRNSPKADGDDGDKGEQTTSESSPSKAIKKDSSEGDNELEIKSEAKKEDSQEAIAVVESDVELDEGGMVEGLCISESENEADQEDLLKETVHEMAGSDLEPDSKTDMATSVQNASGPAETVPAVQRSKTNQQASSQSFQNECKANSTQADSDRCSSTIKKRKRGRRSGVKLRLRMQRKLTMQSLDLKQECFPENIDEFVTVDEVGDVEAGNLDLEDLTPCAESSKLETDEANVSILTEKSEDTTEQKEEDVEKPKIKHGQKRGMNIKTKRTEGDQKDGSEDGNELIDSKMESDEKNEMQGETVSTCAEPESKRARSRSPTPDEYRLGLYQPNNPVGLDYVVPKTGYYCTLCCLFYTKEEVAKKTHCSSLPHYQKLKKMLDKQAEDYRKSKREQSPEVQIEEITDQ
ncbi:matrin-3-like isoform X2 [Mobula hypostoma]|uniref:matrin-3-like isoform X2 n=1 Tax=Mobula hypostoma TaxID=723540 RepID=UPI002FC3DBD7